MFDTTKRAIKVAILIAAVTVASAIAGSMKLTLAETAIGSDAIFVGTVVEKSARWNTARTMIWTDYRFVVEERWHGLSPMVERVVSVAGGTVEGRSIALTHVPTFEVDATYVVAVYANERLHAAPTVGVEQGIFREVEDVESGDKILVDYHGYVMEKLADGTVVRGGLSHRTGKGQVAQRLSEDDLIDMEEQRIEERLARRMAEPVYHDPYGRVVESPPQPPRTARDLAVAKVSDQQRGVPANRADLRAFFARHLGGNAGAGS